MERNPRWLLGLLAASVALCGGFGRAIRQEPQHPAAASAQPDQVQWCREGILDPAARPDVRRRWACRLLQLKTGVARSVAGELLAMPENPDARRAVAEAISECARADREILDESFLNPLFDLLGSAAPDMRQAASRAIGEFPALAVAAMLGEIARQPIDPNAAPAQRDLQLAKKLAAIDALAPNVHRRTVAAELIKVLDDPNPAVVERAIAALQSVTRTPIGNDREMWKAWWVDVAAMREEDWLADQLDMNRDRALAAQSELETLRDQSRRQQASLAARLGEFMRNTFRYLPGDQRETELIGWLKDPLPEVSLAAIELIKSRLADEGQRPEGAVLSTLLQLAKEGSPQVRRQALLILQNLNDAAVIETLLARLPVEDDPATRAAVIRALGKLGAVEAIPGLIREIGSKDASPDCAREAALSLGLIAARPDAAVRLNAAVAPLRAKYAELTDGDSALRAGLLTAMAGIADPSFQPAFLAAAESDDPAVLRQAIRGLRMLGDNSKMTRLRTLTADKDPLVRVAAITAIGELGREEADLESIVPRLNPTVEASEPAREAAWKAFAVWHSRRPIAERIRAADRLRDLPDLQDRYLDELIADLAATEPGRPEIESLRERLVTSLVGQGKFAAATSQLRELYALRAARGDANTFETGIRWLDAALRTPGSSGAGEVIQKLADGTDTAVRGRVIAVVAQFADSPEVAADADRARKLQGELQSVPGDELGEAWQQLLRRLVERTEPVKDPTVPGS